MADDHARVLREETGPSSTGCTRSATPLPTRSGRHTYGAGATIAQGLVYGYIAALPMQPPDERSVGAFGVVLLLDLIPVGRLRPRNLGALTAFRKFASAKSRS